MDIKNQLPTNEWVTPLLENRNTTKRRRQCGFCGNLGHNKRTCPQLINNGTSFSCCNDVLTYNTRIFFCATFNTQFFLLESSNINITTTINNDIPLERNIFQLNNDVTNDAAPGTESTSFVTNPDEVLTNEENENINDNISIEQSSSSDDDEPPDRTLLPTTMYVVFDLETTGLSRERHQIIEIAGQVLDPIGNPYGDSFELLVNPLCPLTYWITNVTGIHDKDLVGQPLFREAVTDFFKYITTAVRQYEEQTNNQMQRIVFIAHNGIRFDIPFLFNKIKSSRLTLLDNIIHRLYVLDTLVLAKEIVRKQSLNVPKNYTLGTLYKYVTGSDMSNAHRALVDVRHTIIVAKYGKFWFNKDEYIFKVQMDGTVDRGVAQNKDKKVRRQLPVPPDDSDTDDSEDEKEEPQPVLLDNDPNDVLEDITQPIVEATELSKTPTIQHVVGWTANTPFAGVDVESMFEAKLQSTSAKRKNNNEPLRAGLQCSRNSVNSPAKAWNRIFTNGLLEKIVSYTNEYGSSKMSTWTDINRDKLIDFFCILFISGIQKRKDRVSNWWSENPFLENPVAKRIMTGREFSTMLRFLHCCPLHPPTTTEYDPGYKIQEIMDMLQVNYDKSFVPGQQLSLDESLIRAFGRIRFKVRIITKAARYGIKLYVLTDAETSFVLRVIIYTGKSTYDEKYGEMKKTVQVVRRLVEDYSGSFRTVYVDRFYTSMDLIKELDGMDLYVTGTVMTNKIPKEFVILPSSSVFKNMERGEHKCHKYTYFDDNNQPRESGLVAWKDTNIVYMLTNNCNTADSSTCTHGTKFGEITIRRPNVISEYNKYMGGVDLADMKRLHCNSTIMCQNRWWLKLFFYNLDVATSNALVLYQLAINDTKINVVDFKLRLLAHFLGSRAERVSLPLSTEKDQHHLVRLPNDQRLRCAFCSLQAKKGETVSRTRFVCSHPNCGIPLCSIGTQEHSTKDCFALCHANDNLLNAAINKHEEMMKSVTNANKKKGGGVTPQKQSTNKKRNNSKSRNRK